jgi:RNA polymerase sigma-70 factor (ECF subfamily)
MARGDEAAYERFMVQYAERLLYYLLVVHRGNEASAKECLQATMIRVVRHIRVFDEDERAA